MYKLIRRYLRRVDGGYLALCAVCSALSILVLVSIGQTQLGSNNKASVQLLSALFGLLLAVVFSILCEGTVYGNTIARKPFQDTIGTAVGVAANIAVCAVLVPRFGVMGAAVGLVAANATMFLYRTVTGQYYYRTIPSFSRTLCGFLLAVGVAVIGVVFAHNFIIKFVLTAAILFIYCNIYRAQLYKLWQISMGFVRRYLLHSQA